jgi:predicted DCC family thiol-disulfide oxidoreductase YuxK
MRLADREAYSYRSIVPLFDDKGPVVFMDGDCALCSRAARAIAKFDRASEFRICPIQSELGRAIFRHYGLDADNPDSWLYLADGKAYDSLDAVIRVGTRLGGLGHFLRVFGILPRGMQDWIYRRIAFNRYAIFGRANMCAIPDGALRQRLLS